MCARVAQGLLQILQHLVSAPHQAAPEVCLCIKLVWKTFWSATYMGIPDLLTSPEHMNGWLTALIMSLSQTPPPVRTTRVVHIWFNWFLQPRHYVEALAVWA